jgi:hypothetical protein
MFLKKRFILQREQYRLMDSCEKARTSWMRLKKWRMADNGDLHAEMPGLLAEMRYRFLLYQARKRKWVNHWYLEE